MHAYAYRTAIFRSIPYHQLEGVAYSDGEWSLLPLAGVSRVRYCPGTVYRYLLGRDRQTMEDAQMVKNYWMLGEVALDIVSQFEALRPKMPDEIRHPLLRAVVGYVANVHRGGIISRKGLAKNIDLVDFDRRLSVLSADIHRLVAEEPYSRRLPYRFVRAWRSHSPFLPIMRKVCLAYSALARKLARGA